MYRVKEIDGATGAPAPGPPATPPGADTERRARMIRATLFLALAAGLAALPAAADDEFLSPPAADALRAGRQAAFDAKLRPEASAKAVTVEEVGDADSFGRNMKWLGLMSGYVELYSDCTPPPGEPADPRCIPLNPAPAFTPYTLADVAVVTLPGRSTHSLICHWQTPIISVACSNATGARQPYRFQALASYRIESEVLQGLNDPNSGDPYNGAIELALGSINDAGYLEDGDFFTRQYTQSRTCIGGLVSKRALVDQYGLTEAQARRFFREPVTTRMSIRGNARMVEAASINFGTRFTGD